ncbi:hypothetical protein [Streptomyces sp. NBC_00989]|uniref:hypothetical protein n=1 Tax=Streptomyces sp. NBC_00989 TaxID=2903705 RepID=UPI002F90B5A7|nr:hypothetical protein OG714_55435 [Streptomyces sp. NBC_00989]
MSDTCPSGRRRYPDRAAARAAFGATRARGKPTRGYRKCGICGGWHLTPERNHRPRRRRRARTPGRPPPRNSADRARP